MTDDLDVKQLSESDMVWSLLNRIKAIADKKNVKLSELKYFNDYFPGEDYWELEFAENGMKMFCYIDKPLTKQKVNSSVKQFRDVVKRMESEKK